MAIFLELEVDEHFFISSVHIEFEVFFDGPTKDGRSFL